MKRLEKIFITNILLAILICTMPINEAKADDVLYVSSYSEDDMQMMREYSAKSVMYLTLTDIDTNELTADVIVSILYDYADGYWVEMNNVYLSIECYEGYLVFVDENQEIYQDYGVRYCTISNSDGLNIKYNATADPQAKKEHIHCLNDKPKNMLSVYCLISLFIFTSI